MPLTDIRRAAQALRGRRPGAGAAEAPRQRLYFLVSSAHSPGGLAHVVVNLANHLCAYFDVEIISVFRRTDESFYPIDDRVKVTYLVDQRGGESDPVAAPFLRRVAKRLDSRPSGLVPRPALKDQRMSRLTDLVTWWYLRALPPGILVSTHPSLHVASIRYAGRSMIKVGQEHMSYEGRNDAIKRVLQRKLRKLDAIAILTETDLEQFRRMTEGSPTVVTSIPNALSWPAVEQGAALRNKVVMTAGALLPRKGHRRLIEAFAPVATAHPDWELHIYGSGRSSAQLAKFIKKQGLTDHVKLKGRTDRMQEVLLESSIFTLSSMYEGFPMVLPEALSKGVPVVSFDCPTGPAEIITHGRDGFLVPNGDVPAFTRALLTLIEDDELRSRMGAAALEAGHRYDMKAIGERWTQLFEQLSRQRTATGRDARAAR